MNRDDHIILKAMFILIMKGIFLLLKSGVGKRDLRTDYSEFLNSYKID